MADDILIKIKEAEESASKEVSDAKARSQEIIRKAKDDADIEYKIIISDTNKKAQSLIDEANRKAKIDKEPTLQKAREASSNILNTSNKNVEVIIKTLTERIVKDGNS